MRTKMTRVGVAFVAGAFMIVGCSKADRSNPDSAAAARTDTGMARVGAAADTLAGRTDTGVNAPKRGGWTDASILGFTAAANGGEIGRSKEDVNGQYHLGKEGDPQDRRPHRSQQVAPLAHAHVHPQG